AVRRQVAGELVQRLTGGGEERLAEHEVLDGVPGERQFREDRQVGAGVSGGARLLTDEANVAVEIADGGVDLGESETQGRHGAHLPLAGDPRSGRWPECHATAVDGA